MPNNIRALWIDPVFYVSAFAFALFFALLIYSVRRYIEASNAAESYDSEEGEQTDGFSQDFPEEDYETDMAMAEGDAPEPEMGENNIAPESSLSDMEQEPKPAPDEDSRQIPANIIGEDVSKAGEFVKGIFNGISDIDERLKSVEKTLATRKLNADFALRLLEDILEEYDSINKEEVKAKIKYLVDDLKK